MRGGGGEGCRVLGLGWGREGGVTLHFHAGWWSLVCRLGGVTVALEEVTMGHTWVRAGW